MNDNPGNPQKKTVVSCPTCGRAVPYDRTSPFRPFCSERCRLVDFGGWANERFRVPGEAPPDGQTDQDTD